MLEPVVLILEAVKIAKWSLPVLVAQEAAYTQPEVVVVVAWIVRFGVQCAEEIQGKELHEVKSR